MDAVVSSNALQVRRELWTWSVVAALARSLTSGTAAALPGSRSCAQRGSSSWPLSRAARLGRQLRVRSGAGLLCHCPRCLTCPSHSSRAVPLRASFTVATVSEPSAAPKAPRSYESKNKQPREGAPAAAAPRTDRPKRASTVSWSDLAVGKQFKGTVVRPRAGHTPSPGLATRRRLQLIYSRRPALQPTASSSTSAPPRPAWRTSRSCRCGDGSAAPPQREPLVVDSVPLTHTARCQRRRSLCRT